MKSWIRNLTSEPIWLYVTAFGLLFVRFGYNYADGDLDEVLQRYQNTLKPMHEQFIEPMKEYADIIIPNNKYNTVAVNIVRTIINERL